MPERGSMFGLSRSGVRLRVLRKFVRVVVVAVMASTGAAPPVEACTPKPNGPASQGRHWYYILRAKRQCWHLGSLGHAARRSSTQRLRHFVAVAHKSSAAPETAAAGPTVTPPAANGADALAPALPPREAAGAERWLPAGPAQQETAQETRPPDAIAPAFAPMPALAAMPAPPPMTAPAAEPAEAPQPAATARPAWAAGGDLDHVLAAIVIAAVLLMIAGPVLWAMRRWSGRNARADTPSAPAARPAREGEPTPLVLARTAVRRRRPSGARNEATEEIGPPPLPDHATPHQDPGGATRPSP